MHLTFRDNQFGDGLSLQRQPLIQTKSIQHWTSLVEDDVASHLLSFYFNWENPTWHLIDQEVFIHDLETRSTKFCSPLLVHILLLFGCVRLKLSFIWLQRLTSTRAFHMAFIRSPIEGRKRHSDRSFMMRSFNSGHLRRKQPTSQHYNLVSYLVCFVVLLEPIDWAPNSS